jgi:hypothetical protein
MGWEIEPGGSAGKDNLSLVSVVTLTLSIASVQLLPEAVRFCLDKQGTKRYNGLS